MTAGEREVVREAAELFRFYETHHRRRAEECSDNLQQTCLNKAERNRAMAEKLERLLADG